MSRALAQIKAHFGNWRQWELNPVVVKELRQSVRSWAVTGTLLLFLLVLFCAAVIFFVTQSFDLNTDQRMGATIFSTFSVILTGASLLFIPLYIGIRVAAERQESDLDLLYISTLTPGRIIRGKFFCGAYVALLFFSACMPFMTFTNLLRGIDLPSVFFVLLCLYLVVCCAVQVAIFLACLPVSKLLKILIGLFALFLTFWLTAGITVTIAELVQRGIGSMMAEPTFWGGFLTLTSVVLGIALLLYFFSVGLVSPPSANRAFPIRIYLTIIWTIGGVLSLIWALHEKEPRLILLWAVPSIVLFGLSLVVTVSNHDTLSIRVRRDIPERLAPRALAFLFFNGAAGGLLWAAILLSVTFVTVSVFLKAHHSTITPIDVETIDEIVASCAASICYLFAYALAGLLVHRKFFGRRAPRLAGIFAVIIPAAWALFPVFYLFFLNRLTSHSLEGMQPGNIFNVVGTNDLGQLQLHVLYSVGGLAVMVVLNLKWFLQQARNFQPWHRSTVIAPPIIPVPVS